MIIRKKFKHTYIFQQQIFKQIIKYIHYTVKNLQIILINFNQQTKYQVQTSIQIIQKSPILMQIILFVIKMRLNFRPIFLKISPLIQLGTILREVYISANYKQSFLLLIMHTTQKQKISKLMTFILPNSIFLQNKKKHHQIQKSHQSVIQIQMMIQTKQQQLQPMIYQYLNILKILIIQKTVKQILLPTDSILNVQTILSPILYFKPLLNSLINTLLFNVEISKETQQ
ncbi:hypothetical protein IMG5_164950 [Ichthyophthirius multifiliis]|uniref:Uncharacterized protein n=1 Tax=Ichthyophthirius multifiliis TaxID=5932 RepID=G0R0H5_ICHMU|nr:hypothetical protein IMG5_164950 [Ichthyophthirius multifiliis]EGR29026.1 hypothetical protein IMG5_164950 [Ichthyophthirius multifiliis]|eukprot:XP_004030262.1 hypothetical protein IMG5_164950 [Ichthyophthirius multifiliis]